MSLDSKRVLRLETNAGDVPQTAPLPTCLADFAMDIDAAERMLGADGYAKMRSVRQRLASPMSSPRKLQSAVDDGLAILRGMPPAVASDLIAALELLSRDIAWARGRKARWIRLALSHPKDPLDRQRPMRLPRGSKM